MSYTIYTKPYFIKISTKPYIIISTKYVHFGPSDNGPMDTCNPWIFIHQLPRTVMEQVKQNYHIIYIFATNLM